MATYVEIFDLKGTGYSNVPDLKKKVTVAVAKAAMVVLAEPSSTPGNSARLRWARTALTQAEAAAEQMMWAVLGNATVQEQGNAVSDSDIQWVVNSLIDTFAQ